MADFVTLLDRRLGRTPDSVSGSLLLGLEASTDPRWRALAVSRPPPRSVDRSVDPPADADPVPSGVSSAVIAAGLVIALLLVLATVLVAQLGG